MGKKVGTVVDAARALIDLCPSPVFPGDRIPMEKILSSAYRTSEELRQLHSMLSRYSVGLELLGFSYDELAVPAPGPAPGAVQLEIPGQYKVEALPDLSAGIVDAGNGRVFLSLAWGGPRSGTILFRKNDSPNCWVEVANYLDRKDPERAVSCLLLGRGDPGNPFDTLKKKLSASERRNLKQVRSSVKSSLQSSGKSVGREGNVGRNS